MPARCVPPLPPCPPPTQVCVTHHDLSFTSNKLFFGLPNRQIAEKWRSGLQSAVDMNFPSPLGEQRLSWLCDAFRVAVRHTADGCLYAACPSHHLHRLRLPHHRQLPHHLLHDLPLRYAGSDMERRVRHHLAKFVPHLWRPVRPTGSNTPPPASRTLGACARC